MWCVVVVLVKVVGRRAVVGVVVAMATVVVAVTRAVVAHRHRPLSHVVALSCMSKGGM